MPINSALLNSSSKVMTASSGYNPIQLTTVIDDNMSDSTQVIGNSSVVAIIAVLGIVVAIILTSVIMFVIFKLFMPSKRQNKASDVTHEEIPMNTRRITNGNYIYNQYYSRYCI